MKALSVGSISVGSVWVIGGCITLMLLVVVVLSYVSLKNSRDSKVLTEEFTESLGSVKTAKFNLSASTGNLTIDRLTGNEEVLASGTLQYLENQGLPARSVNRSNDQASFALKMSGEGQPWFCFPWQKSSKTIEWQVHLNPSVPSDITVYSGSGNIRLRLAQMVITRVSASTGGGSVFVSLPDNTANSDVTAKTGGGNVTVEIGAGITGKSSVTAQSGGGDVVVHLPGSTAARITATSGWGKVTVDSHFIKLDEKTYQSSDYERADNKVEITLQTGAGDVTVTTR